VSELGFLSPDRTSEEAVWRSPLERALAHAPAGLEDVSRTGILEVRGDVNGLALDGCDVVQLTPQRALVLCDPAAVPVLRAKLRRQFRAVIDQSAGYAGLRVRGAAVLHRVTDLDLDGLPAAGAVAHVPGIVLHDDEDTFRIIVPQEYGHYVAEVVADAAEGLGAV
jgi:hypothetical protein